MKKDFSNRETTEEIAERLKEEPKVDNSQREIQSVMISDGVYKSVYKDNGQDVV